MGANLIILAGIPGCGKSTWAKNYFDLHYAIISSDAIRKRIFSSLKAAHPDDADQKAVNNSEVFKEFHKRIDENLCHSVDTIADATNLRRDSRQRLLDIAKKDKAEAHLVLFTNTVQAVYQNLRRDPDQVVPEEAMLKFLLRMEDTAKEIEGENYTSITEIGKVG